MSQTVVTTLDELAWRGAVFHDDPRRERCLELLARLRDPDGVADEIRRSALGMKKDQRNSTYVWGPLSEIQTCLHVGRAFVHPATFQAAEYSGDITHLWSRAFLTLAVMTEALGDPDGQPDIQAAVATWDPAEHFGPARAGNVVRALRRLAPPWIGHAVVAAHLLDPMLVGLNAHDVSDQETLSALANSEAGRKVLGGLRAERFVLSVLAVRAIWWRGRGALRVFFRHDGHDLREDGPVPASKSSGMLDAQIAYALEHRAIDTDLADLLRHLPSMT